MCPFGKEPIGSGGKNLDDDWETSVRLFKCHYLCVITSRLWTVGFNITQCSRGGKGAFLFDQCVLIISPKLWWNCCYSALISHNLFTASHFSPGLPRIFRVAWSSWLLRISACLFATNARWLSQQKDETDWKHWQMDQRGLRVELWALPPLPLKVKWGRKRGWCPERTAGRSIWAS